MIRAAHFSEKMMLENLYIDVMLLDHTEYFITNSHLTVITAESLISEKYQNLVAVFFKKQVKKLSAHGPQDHKINTEEKQSSFKSIYNLSVAELQTLYHYINVNLENKFIYKS